MHICLFYCWSHFLCHLLSLFASSLLLALIFTCFTYISALFHVLCMVKLWLVLDGCEPMNGGSAQKLVYSIFAFLPAVSCLWLIFALNSWWWISGIDKQLGRCLHWEHHSSKLSTCFPPSQCWHTPSTAQD